MSLNGVGGSFVHLCSQLVISTLGPCLSVRPFSLWERCDGEYHILLSPLLQCDWLNNYHLTCRDVIGKELQKQGRQEALEWLIRETQPISKQR